MKKALAFGTFDIFHKGHEFYLKQAGKYGKLYVIVARDSTVKKVKGKYPLNNEKKRLKVIQDLDYVDKAYLGKDFTNLVWSINFWLNIYADD